MNKNKNHHSLKSDPKNTVLVNDLWTRREFLRSAFITALTTGIGLNQNIIAGAVVKDSFKKLIPEDKKLSQAWINSLFERGHKTIYQGTELEKIGMPIGGICAGQLYLGGDGTLWHWDIFNQQLVTGADHYAHPMSPSSPLKQGFAIKINDQNQSCILPMTRSGWKNITFNGEYPLGRIEYSDPQIPVRVSLEAFSPFIPLNVNDSSIPATIMRFTITNTSSKPLEIEVGGWLENAVCIKSHDHHNIQRCNRIVRTKYFTFLECSAEELLENKNNRRPDIVFDDFEDNYYRNWQVDGSAFGSGPISHEKVPPYQGDLNMHGQHAVNSHSSAPGNSIEEKDSQTGSLLSQPFKIVRDYINFLIGGGAHKNKTCVNLIIDNKVVLSSTGQNNNKMTPVSWNVSQWAGKTAQIQIVDQEKGGWGNIGVDYIVFSDQPQTQSASLTSEPDFGNMGLALLQNNLPTHTRDFASASLPDSDICKAIFDRSTKPLNYISQRPSKTLCGGLTRKIKLQPGKSESVDFVISWFFPNIKIDKLDGQRYYSTLFTSARNVVKYISLNFNRLREQTLLWHDTWYDSSLPYWFLDRTFLNTSILASSTCLRFSNGRFWAWEGVGCCAGTCAHVWQYAQAVARLFPELERDTRTRVDLGLAMQPNGAIFFRGEFNNFPAIDAQAGVVLRAFREHQMCPDSNWLKDNWPKIKKALQWLIDKDENKDGIIDGNQHNTLDTDWYGSVAWLSGLYLCALKAGMEMAKEMQDPQFLEKCQAIFTAGQKNIVEQLFNGEYFINKPDPKHPEAINSGTGCFIDQVLGQSWAFQIGLGRILPKNETMSALKSLWRYNFTTDVGPYRSIYKPGRWYAMPGEGGLLMCTFPYADWDYENAKGKGPDWAAGYFNECMTGFEYQVAAHMIAEGLVMEGLAVTRMIHDRYHPLKRNPWNEVECGDHYARAMASYGVFISACGYEYHGPKGFIGFHPRINPHNFKCAFTAAEGWGTFSQNINPSEISAKILVKFGRLKLSSLSLDSSFLPSNVTVDLNGKTIKSTFSYMNEQVYIRLINSITITQNQSLTISIKK